MAYTNITSTTRPSSPVVGQIYYETDTQQYVQFDFDTNQWEVSAIPIVTPNNTLDDGSGNVTALGDITIKKSVGQLTFNVPGQTNTSYVGWNANSTNDFGMVMNVNGNNVMTWLTNGQITSKNNTLDDGIGNLTVTGQISLPKSGQVFNFAPTIVNGHSDFSFTSATGSNDMHSIAWSRNTQWNTAFQVYDNTASINLFVVGTDKSVKSQNNILDDGVGNATFTGTITVGHITSLPTASASNRGQMAIVQGNGTTTADTLYVCMMSATGTYSWKSVISG